MARRTATVTEAPADETVETTNESTEAPAEATESTPEAEVDFTAFKSAVETAVAKDNLADADTGKVSDEQIALVNEAFRALPTGKPRSSMKEEYLVGEMKSALDNADMIRARALVDVRENLSGASRKSRAEAEPADPTEAFVEKVASLQYAWSQVTENVPEGVSEDWEAKVNELLSSDEFQAEYKAYAEYQELSAEDREGKEEPKASRPVKTAFKLASGKVRASSGKSGPAYSGPTRNVLKHIEEVLADVEPGTFLKISEVTGKRSSEYGDDAPSSGAVSSRMFPKDKEPYEGETFKAAVQDGKKGIVRL